MHYTFPVKEKKTTDAIQSYLLAGIISTNIWKPFPFSLSGLAFLKCIISTNIPYHLNYDNITQMYTYSPDTCAKTAMPSSTPP